ncbi:MAG: hypothetical protein NVS4B9_11590 [Ktedonobacteraceae bacterium]
MEIVHASVRRRAVGNVPEKVTRWPPILLEVASLSVPWSLSRSAAGSMTKRSVISRHTPSPISVAEVEVTRNPLRSAQRW